MWRVNRVVRIEPQRHEKLLWGLYLGKRYQKKTPFLLSIAPLKVKKCPNWQGVQGYLCNAQNKRCFFLGILPLVAGLFIESWWWKYFSYSLDISDRICWRPWRGNTGKHFLSILLILMSWFWWNYMEMKIT